MSGFSYEVLEARGRAPDQEAKVRFRHKGQKILHTRWFKVTTRAEFEIRLGEYLYQVMMRVGRAEVRKDTRYPIGSDR